MIYKHDESNPKVERLNTDLAVIGEPVYHKVAFQPELRDGQDSYSRFKAHWGLVHERAKAADRHNAQLAQNNSMAQVLFLQIILDWGHFRQHYSMFGTRKQVRSHLLRTRVGALIMHCRRASGTCSCAFSIRSVLQSLGSVHVRSSIEILFGAMCLWHGDKRWVIDGRFKVLRVSQSSLPIINLSVAGPLVVLMMKVSQAAWVCPGVSVRQIVD